MSAEMIQREEYGWYCGECGAGSAEWIDADDIVEREIRDHNEEQHA